MFLLVFNKRLLLGCFQLKQMKSCESWLKKKKQLKQNHIWNVHDALRGILTGPFLQVFLEGVFWRFLSKYLNRHHFGFLFNLLKISCHTDLRKTVKSHFDVTSASRSKSSWQCHRFRRWNALRPSKVLVGMSWRGSTGSPRTTLRNKGVIAGLINQGLINPRKKAVFLGVGYVRSGRLTSHDISWAKVEFW